MEQREQHGRHQDDPTVSTTRVRHVAVQIPSIFRGGFRGTEDEVANSLLEEKEGQRTEGYSEESPGKGTGRAPYLAARSNLHCGEQVV